MATHFVIQWARLGDLFQTRPLLSRIRARDPSADILLCIDEIYLSLASTFPEADRVIGIPLRHYWALAQTEHHLDDTFNEFQKLHERLGSIRPDVVYILNKSAAAVRFAEILRPEEIRGFHKRTDSFDPPMAYLERMFADPSAPPAHLADLWAALAGVSNTPMEFPTALAVKSASSSTPSGKRIGIIVGAGDSNRIWPLENWLQFLSNDSLSQCEFLLLGTERDTQTAIQLENFCRKSNLRIQNAAGRTSFSQLGSFLSSCNLVIGSDTGGIHFTAALGTKVLGLFFAGAWSPFTGPYAAQARVLERKQFSSQNQIPVPQDVARLARAIISGKDETEIQLGSGFAFRFPQLDSHSLLYLSPNERYAVSSVTRKLFWQILSFPYSKLSAFQNPPSAKHRRSFLVAEE